MKRNSIYLRSKFSDKELALLKLDLINNSIYFISKIKNLNLDKTVIEEIVKNAINNVLSNYKFGQDGNLGDLVKTSVIADLKVYYENIYPDQANKVLWPNLDKRAPFTKLLEALEKVHSLSEGIQENIFVELGEELTERQQNILSTIYRNPHFTYAEVSKLHGKRGVMTYREIKIIYNYVTQTFKNLEINL